MLCLLLYYKSYSYVNSDYCNDIIVCINIKIYIRIKEFDLGSERSWFKIYKKRKKGNAYKDVFKDINCRVLYKSIRSAFILLLGQGLEYLRKALKAMSRFLQPN